MHNRFDSIRSLWWTILWTPFDTTWRTACTSPASTEIARTRTSCPRSMRSRRWRPRRTSEMVLSGMIVIQVLVVPFPSGFRYLRCQYASRVQNTATYVAPPPSLLRCLRRNDIARSSTPVFFQRTRASLPFVDVNPTRGHTGPPSALSYVG